MEIVKKTSGKKMEARIIGKIDTNTSVQLREEIADKLGGITELVLDFQDTVYVSSAGMRVLLACQKTMDEAGSMTICNVKPEILKIFKATGMLDLLNIR